jgi:hypothetical protein
MIQLAYRNAKSASDFVPGGTTQNDVSLRVVHRLHHSVELDSFVQMEFWKAPILAQGLQRDLSIGVQFSYFPGRGWPSVK